MRSKQGAGLTAHQRSENMTDDASTVENGKSHTSPTKLVLKGQADNILRVSRHEHVYYDKKGRY